MLNLFKRFAREDGSVIVITALAFTVLLGFTALAVDVGLIAVEKARLGRTLDAVVLAGAQELPNTSRAVAVAYEYAVRNEIDPSVLSVTFPTGNTQITATANKTVPLFFAKVFGLKTSDVAGKATAKISPASRVSGILPLGIDQNQLPLQYGNQYVIKVGAYDGVNGWYGIIAYDGPGKMNYKEATINGYDKPVSIGSTFPKETGNSTGPTTQGVRARIDSDSSATWNNYSPDSRRVAIVPIYNLLGKQPNDKVQVTGFASVFLEKVEPAGNDNYVYVRYVNHTVSAETDDSLTNTFLNGVQLIE